MTNPNKNQAKHTKILDMFIHTGYDDHASAKSDDEIGVSYTQSGISTHPIRKGVCFYARSLPTPCACLMVGCAGEQQCSPFLWGGTPILHNPSPFRLASFGDGNSTITQRDQTMKALSFNGVTLTPVHHNSQIYLTSAELAKALGYSSTDKVTNLYHRNADEFSADMTLTLKMGVKGFGNGNSEKETRIFSLRGCHLIAMFARTPVAKDFRKWVLDILDREVGAPVMTETKPTSPTLSTADYAIVQRAVKMIVLGMYFDGVATNAIYARLRQLCGVSNVTKLRYEHLPLVKNELYRIERTLSPYKKMRSDTEKVLLRRICGGDELAVSQAILDIEKTAHDYATATDKRLLHIIDIELKGLIGGEA